MQNQFRLDDLLARDVVPQWFEGVAIVQLVCRELRAAGRESAFPNACDILIAAGGSVGVAGGVQGEPVQTAAHVLGLMLGSDVPVRLRLAVSQATASDGGFTSLTEFSEALAYFERPNPEGIIEAFRQRALIAPRRETASPVRVDAAPAVDKPTAPTPPSSRRGINPLAVGAAAFAMVACAVIWTAGRRLPDLLTPGIATAERSEPTAAAVRPSAKKTAGPTSISQHETNAGAAATSRRVALPESKRGSVVAPPPQLEVVATTVSYRYPTSLTSEPQVEVSATSQPGVIAFLVRDPAPEASDRIYSQADQQVSLPLSVYPKFPNNPTAGTAAGGPTLELTIGANGLVERVKMLSAPRNIHEFMLLSAAKAWRFEPARIDGHPVRFRHVMTLTANP